MAYKVSSVASEKLFSFKWPFPIYVEFTLKLSCDGLLKYSFSDIFHPTTFIILFDIWLSCFEKRKNRFYLDVNWCLARGFRVLWWEQEEKHGQHLSCPTYTTATATQEHLQLFFSSNRQGDPKRLSQVDVSDRPQISKSAITQWF